MPGVGLLLIDYARTVGFHVDGPRRSLRAGWRPVGVQAVLDQGGLDPFRSAPHERARSVSIARVDRAELKAGVVGTEVRGPLVGIQRAPHGAGDIVPGAAFVGVEDAALAFDVERAV